MSKENFKIQGFCAQLAIGEYSDYDEDMYYFEKLPDLEQFEKEINQLWEKEPGDYKGRMHERLEELIERYGGKRVPSIFYLWTGGYGNSPIDFNNNITGKEKKWPRKTR